MNYPLIPNKKAQNILHPSHSSYSEEYARKACSLFLSDEVYEGADRRLRKYYRLHAKDAHNEEMALSYDIKCPCCGHDLKQVGRTLNYYDLGLYICKNCERR